MSKMRAPRVVIYAAWIIQLAAWLFPTIDVLDVPFRGWEIFFVTLSAFWPSNDVNAGAWYDSFLLGLSAVATLLFVLGSPWVVLRGSRSLLRASAWVAVAAFVANAYWCLSGKSAFSELRIGYYLWWSSFAVLALGLFGLAKENDIELIHSRADLLAGPS